MYATVEIRKPLELLLAKCTKRNRWSSDSWFPLTRILGTRKVVSGESCGGRATHMAPQPYVASSTTSSTRKRKKHI